MTWAPKSSTGDEYLHSYQGRAERAGPGWRVIPPEVRPPAAEVTDDALGGGGRKRPRDTHRSDWQLRLSTPRRTAGCRPSVTPGTARHRSATVTSAGRTRA